MVRAGTEKQGPVMLKMTARKVKTSHWCGVWNWFICMFVNEMQVCVISRCMVFGIISPGRCIMGNVVRYNAMVTNTNKIVFI